MMSSCTVESELNHSAATQEIARIRSCWIHRTCPLCERDNRDQPDSRFSHGVWIIKHCANCHFVYLQNVLPYEEFDENYAWSKTVVTARSDRRRREPIFGFVSERFKAFRLKYLWRDKVPSLVKRYVPGDRVLDVGCGTGETLRRLDDRLTPFGIEISSDAARLAREYAIRRGGEVYHCDGLTGLCNLAGQSFDGVLMRCYLEHERQPVEVLRETYRVLRPRGRLIVKVPNFASLNRYVRGARWCGFRYPDHVNYFTPRTLQIMIEQVGLRVCRFGLTGRLPTSDNMCLIAERPDHTPWPVCNFR